MRYQTLIKKLENLEKKIVKFNIQHIEVDLENNRFNILNELSPLFYEPVPTMSKFHKDRNLNKFILGCFGSGKTVGCIADIVLNACRMPKCNDGIRRMRCAIIRNTYGDLIRTTLKTWYEWFENLGKIHVQHVPAFLITHTFNDQYGKVILEIMPIGLDTIKDVPRRLKSLETTMVYLNEASELLLDVFSNFKGRLPRYPKKIFGITEQFWSGVIADTNPPPTHHWIYDLFEKQRIEQHIIYKQPGALLKTDDGYIPNPAAENVDNHINGYDYWLNMILGQTEEWIKVYALGEYGSVSSEQKIYPQYNDDLHSKDIIKIDKDWPIIMAFDFGTQSPACLIVQYVKGQLRCIKEFIGQFISVAELTANFVEPWLVTNCEGMNLETVIYDIADTYDGVEQLTPHNWPLRPCITNNIKPRLHAVIVNLNELLMGQARLIISREGCPYLREGFIGMYHFKKLKIIGEEKFEQKPNKNHPYSDIHDCLQYICLYVNREDAFAYDEPFAPKNKDGISPITGY